MVAPLAIYKLRPKMWLHQNAKFLSIAYLRVTGQTVKWFLVGVADILVVKVAVVVAQLYRAGKQLLALFPQLLKYQRPVILGT